MDTTFLKLLSHKCDIEKKKNLTYISWSEAWAELKKIDTKASYTIYENTEWFPFRESKFWIDCKVWVTLDWLEYIVRLPVMDWANKSMKFEWYEYETKFWKKKVNPASTFDINKTIQRAFVKAIAMHWLGLYVYMWEDLPEEPPKELTKELFDKAIDSIKSWKETRKFEEIKKSLSDKWITAKQEYLDEIEKVIDESILNNIESYGIVQEYF